MGENLMVGSHKGTNKAFRDGWERTFGKKSKFDFAESECDPCPGWKSPEECPHAGIFHLDSSACEECARDAMEAMNEAADLYLK